MFKLIFNNSEVFLLVAYLLLNIFIIAFLVLISYIISPKSYQNNPLKEYECGLTKQSFFETKRSLYSLKIIILYILFEWEITIMYPVASAKNLETVEFLCAILFLILISASTLIEEVGTLLSFENGE